MLADMGRETVYASPGPHEIPQYGSQPIGLHYETTLKFYVTRSRPVIGYTKARQNVYKQRPSLPADALHPRVVCREDVAVDRN